MAEQMRVDYLDTIEGGSGQTTLYLTDIPYWLAKHKGWLIRNIVPISSLSHGQAWRDASTYGWEELGRKVNRQL